MINDDFLAAGGPAFPTNGYLNGMSLRDHFAAAALTGYLVAFASDLPTTRVVARDCYNYADAMLAERLRRKGAEGA